MFAFLAGWRLYVLVALVASFAGLAGYAALEHERRLVADAQKANVQRNFDEVSTKLAQSEVDKAELEKRGEELDALIVVQQQRAKELEHEKAQVWEQFDKLAQSQSPADQGCMSRPLPDAVVRWVYDDGPADSHSIPKAESPGKPAPPST